MPPKCPSGKGSKKTASSSRALRKSADTHLNDAAPTGPRTYAGTTRSMATSEPPEDDRLGSDYTGEPLDTENSSPYSLNLTTPTAEEAWHAHNPWGDFDPDDMERVTSPVRASLLAMSTGSSPSKRAHSARIAAAKRAKMPVHPPTVAAHPSTPVAPTGWRMHQATTPNAAVEKPTSKHLRKAAATMPSISIDQAEAAMAPTCTEAAAALAHVCSTRRVSFSSRPVTIPTPDYDVDSPQAHVPTQLAHVKEERIVVRHAELNKLVQKAMVAAMAKYSVQDSAVPDNQPSHICIPSFVDEPAGPSCPATYSCAAALSSFSATSRLAAPASFGATSCHADAASDDEDFADLDVVVPASIRKNIVDSIPRMISLLELTPAKCAAAERERDVDTTMREFVINEKGHVATWQAHTKNAAGKSTISPADFIIAGDTLGRTIKTYFPNKQQGRHIAAQLDTHLCSMRAEPDFTTHSPRYCYYHSYIFRSFIQGKTEDMSVINPRLWAKALERHHDETITAGLQTSKPRCASAAVPA
ncbi:hypothetical protein FB451DRAFT_1161997 [Mycena latifolia]|nr:hypothetical protein FB451DRAFT_1161997 [Mycena latifolia]